MTCRAASHYPFLDMLRLPFEEAGPMYSEKLSCGLPVKRFEPRGDNLASPPQEGDFEWGNFDTPEANERERAQDTISQIEKGE